MSVQIQIRRDLAANFTSDNPVLAQGEFGEETNTLRVKLGDGATAWTALGYEAEPLAVLLAGTAFTGAPTVNGQAVVANGDVMDMVALYGCAPGADVTTAITTAIAAALTANKSVVHLYFSEPGIYNINGAQQAAPGSATITGVTTANPGVVTTSAAHGFITGQAVTVASVGGATQANGTWAVTVIDSTHFSVPVNVTGTYTSGGTAVSPYAYSGQVLFPPTANALTVVFEGTSPIIGNPDLTGGAAGGVVLLSNATSGWVFDGIPNNDTIYPQTNIIAVFDKIRVRCPNNPQCGGINGSTLQALQIKPGAGVDVNSDSPTYPPTGGTIGIVYPPVDCDADQLFEDGFVAGFTTAIKHSEHFTVSGRAYIQSCTNAYAPYGNRGSSTPRHLIDYGHTLLQGVQVGINVPSGGTFSDGYAGGAITGKFDVGDNYGGGYLQYFVYDPSDVLFGDPKVSVFENGAAPVIGGTNLSIGVINGNVISPVGSLQSGGSVASPVATLTGVVAKNVGDLMVVGIRSHGSSVSASSISYAGVTTWTKAIAFAGTTPSLDVEIWYGVVTTAETGGASLAVTFGSAITSVVLLVQEFSKTTGSAWGVDGSGGSAQGTSGTATAPSLTPAGTGEMYLCIIGGASQVITAAPATTNCTYELDSASPAYDGMAFNMNVSNGGGAVAPQFGNTTTWASVAVLITA